MRCYTTSDILRSSKVQMQRGDTMTRLSSRWQSISKTLAVIAVIASVLVLFILTGYKLTWTGFFNKTLWDWLNLLGVLAIPAVVGLGTIWFTRQQGKVSNAENKDNQRETTLQGYLDRMTELLLKEKLRASKPDDEVRNIARVRTLTALCQLDAYRNGYVLTFLQESFLVNIDSSKSIINLTEADLTGVNLSKTNLSKVNLSKGIFRGADLSGADLRGADLSGADLREVNLIGASLNGAILSETDLRGADLSGADLQDANLSRATITPKQVEKAKSLKGATMPDGSTHP